MKIAILGIIAYYIYLSLSRQRQDFLSVWQYWQKADWLSLPAVLLLGLTPVNWLLEARKWQILVRRIEPLSLGEALRGVLSGLSMGFALPAQLGDTAGRLLSLRSDQRFQGIGASLVSGGMQFYAALLFGTVALISKPDIFQENFQVTYRALLASLLVCLFLGGITAMNRHRLAQSGISWLKRWEKYWSVAAYYSSKELWQALGTAMLRYLTFSLQFYLSLRLFEVILPALDMAAGIGLVYLGKTIIPAFNLLSDLGIREATSLWVFGQWDVRASQVLSATLTLWLVNILTPVLAGFFLIWKIKIGQRRDP
ncbi:lysylphosphatidylglycerol synthase domain-containing protein [Larkinella soli]|uniref:lysylphosphatidylglycerol synthase domain-containing protein n=1 Tax=Larkinella soli TaxID=1770527 RepID=UPI001E442C0C|nr:lysylphosphatidylglycerol synthase domain-containing protein [Larkinella soli]